MTDITQFAEYRDFRQALLELALVSHAPIQGYNLAPAENGKGERWRYRDTRPPIAHLGSHMPKGGDTQVPRGTDIDRPRRADGKEEREAWFASYQRRTVGYFTIEFTRCHDRLLDSGDELACQARLKALAKDCRDTVIAWKRAPMPVGQEPLSRADPNWKRFVAESTLDAGVLANRYDVTRQRIYQIRAAYRIEAA